MDKKKLNRHYHVPGFGEFLVAVWKEQDYQDGSPLWACLVSNRSSEMEPYEDVLYLFEESLQAIQEQLLKIVPLACEECS